MPGLLPVLLMGPGALSVHQLRYLLAFGGDAGAELRRTGHAYLHTLTPWIVLCLALSLGLFLRAIGRTLAGDRSGGRYTVSLGAMWLLSTAALLGIYVAQEWLEGLLAAGHPAGAAAIFALGGWWALPAAACIGLMLAALFHGALWAVQELAARRHCRRPRVRRPAAVRRGPADAFCPTPAPLVAGWCGRGPPA